MALMCWLRALLLDAFAYKFPLLASEAVGCVLLGDAAIGCSCAGYFKQLSAVGIREFPPAGADGG